MANPLRSFFIASLAALTLGSSQLLADGARFDLAGPKLEVRVTRAGVTLPIAQVPNLQPGDKLWVHTAFPSTQSVHYLLIVTFLRGTTNPPPDGWFTRIETWNKHSRDEGTFITVPAEAQQAMLFLAPETGGDFSTLRSAVKGRPGVFVRASKDLNQAGFEQARIEKYIDAMRTIPSNDAKALQQHSSLLALTLALKPNPDCFKQPIDQQYDCLTQSGSQMLLDDGHGQSVADALGNGSGDLINSASSTQMAGGGLYSAYVGTIIDLIRLTSGLHTAQYQYIPAIGFPQGEELNLRLNAPPSFHNPKSVIVIGLPAIQIATPPPLVSADPKHVTCMLQPKLVFGLEGAPLVYSTGFAHNLVLHLNAAQPAPDLPLTPSAFEGGLIPAPKVQRELLPLGQPEAAQAEPAQQGANQAAPEDTGLTGTVKGMWGFDSFTGPTLPLQNVPGKGWKLVTNDPLIAGLDNHLTLASTGTACIQAITADTAQSTGLEEGTDKPEKLTWKTADKPSDKPNEVALTLPLKVPAPESVHLAIQQFGDGAPVVLTAKALSEPAKLASLTFHAGDTTALLSGTSLSQVKLVSLKGILFTPSPTQLPSAVSESAADTHGADHLQLTLAQGADSQHAESKLTPGDALNATVTLKDGRTLTLPTTIEPHRPAVTLLSKNIEQPKDSHFRLAPDDLPLDDKFTFFLKSEENFPRSEQIEISSPDDSLHTMLSITTGTLILQNKHTVLATLDPLKLFGTSAFGPLRLRAVSPDGTAGDWVPLVTLVRLPSLTQVECPARARQQPCTLTGSDLYLVDSFSTDPAFTVSIPVPEGFIGDNITIPHPADSGFYLRLRDDPTVSEQVTLPIVPLPGSQPAPQLTLPPPVNPAPIPVSDPADSPAPAPSSNPPNAPNPPDAPGATSAPPSATPSSQSSTPAPRPN
jgi:hypothetical protein